MKIPALLFLIAVAISLTACAAMTPTAAAERFLDACVDCDAGRMVELCPTMVLADDDAPLFARMHFTVGEAMRLSEDAAEVFVTLTVPDVPRLYAAALVEAIPAMLTGGADLSATVSSLAADVNAPMHVVSVLLPLTRSGIGWAVADASPLIDALWGSASILRSS